MKRILLVGGGHSHAVVLRSLGRQPLLGARITLVTPAEHALYSGMLPGVIAGHYALNEARIDLLRLCERAYAEFVKGEVEQLDPVARRARLKDGTEIGYDLASLNIGSLIDRSIPGSAEHAVAAKPFEAFVERLRTPGRIAIVGAGAAGAELAMALRYRGAAVTLYSDQPAFPARLEKRVRRAFRRTGVDFRPGMPVSVIEPGPLVLAGRSRQEFDLVALTTGAAAPPWLRRSGLATDERGFVLIDDRLRSVSHPEVFAAGDCATLRDAPHSKSGVFAVRHGETLAENLRRAVRGEEFERYAPQAKALTLITCGAPYAIAERGGWSAEGRMIWRWKDWIDRRWVRRLNV